jgi:uncharacterized protein YecE (DUF72 family)
MARVRIGTSGWHYDSWRGLSFPKGLPLKDQLHLRLDPKKPVDVEPS